MNKRRAFAIGAIRKTDEKYVLFLGNIYLQKIALDFRQNENVHCVASTGVSGYNDPLIRMDHSTVW